MSITYVSLLKYINNVHMEQTEIFCQCIEIITNINIVDSNLRPG